MRVRIKGVNRVRKALADGSVAIYYYAWKGGPRLDGEPGSPEFIASYNAAVAARQAKPKDTLRAAIDAYLSSADHLALSERSRKDYAAHARHIDAEFGDMPIKLLLDRRARGEFLAWRDRIAVKSRRNADYRFAILARILSWSEDRGIVPCNPCKNPGRLYRARRTDKVWTQTDEESFLGTAPEHLHLALIMALWTGQRQGDLLALTWVGYDGSHIRLMQQKTGKRVIIPVGAPLKSALDRRRQSLAEDANGLRSVTILTTSKGTPWTRYGFSASWRKAVAKSGIVGLTFHDLRGTAVTRLAKAGCSVPEIATITGHALRDVEQILDSHYLSRDAAMAESAIRKLEGVTLPTERPTAIRKSIFETEKVL